MRRLDLSILFTFTWAQSKFTVDHALPESFITLPFLSCLLFYFYFFFLFKSYSSASYSSSVCILLFLRLPSYSTIRIQTTILIYLSICRASTTAIMPNWKSYEATGMSKWSLLLQLYSHDNSSPPQRHCGCPSKSQTRLRRLVSNFIQEHSSLLVSFLPNFNRPPTIFSFVFIHNFSSNIQILRRWVDLSSDLAWYEWHKAKGREPSKRSRCRS